MKVHALAVKARIETVPALTLKTFMLVAPRDAAGNLPIAPYAVVQPADGSDSSDRFTGPKFASNPRIVIHVVGLTYDQVQSVSELVKAKFVVAGISMQINVTGERGRGLTWSSPIPTQSDNDTTPPTVYNTYEVAWVSEPA